MKPCRRHALRDVLMRSGVAFSLARCRLLRLRPGRNRDPALCRMGRAIPNQVCRFIRLPASDPNIHGAVAREFRKIACPADRAPIVGHPAFDSGFRADARACVRSAHGAPPIPDRSRTRLVRRRNRAVGCGRGHNYKRDCRSHCRCRPRSYARPAMKCAPGHHPTRRQVATSVSPCK